MMMVIMMMPILTSLINLTVASKDMKTPNNSLSLELSMAAVVSLAFAQSAVL